MLEDGGITTPESGAIEDRDRTTDHTCARKHSNGMYTGALICGSDTPTGMSAMQIALR
jgi:hypothetical protein